MTFYQLRISIIPLVLLSTGLGIVAWMARLGMERQRTSRVVTVVRGYEAGHLDQPGARARLLTCATEGDLLKWTNYPTLAVRYGAVRGLGLIGTVRSTEALTGLLSSQNPRLRALAESALRQARRRSGNPEVDTLLSKAERLRNAGRSAEALEVLDSCTRLLPGHAETYFLFGTILLHQGESRTARVAFSKAVGLDAGHFDAYLGRGICYLNEGRPRKARADFLRALEINPNMEEAGLLLEDL